MRLLFLGDVVGEMGRKQVQEYLPRLKQKYKPQMTIVNGENATNGKGLNEKHYKELLTAGADFITMGNHTWANREILDYIHRADKLVRPANFPKGTPGVGMRTARVNDQYLTVINIQGRVFMESLDNPFEVIDDLLEEAHEFGPHIFVDFHAETTSETQAMGWYLDGRVTAVVGTHTHVQTNDARVLPGGTAYITDVGMTGPNDGILGVKKEIILKKFLTQMPVRHEVVEEGSAILSGVFIDTRDDGRAYKIETIRIDASHPFRD